MSNSERSGGPTLAKSRGAPENGIRSTDAFSELLKASAREPSAAQGLALAYAALGIESRLRVIDAVVSDSAREGICSSSVLASLLAVEDDIAVARRIASEMSAAGDEGLRCAEADNKALLCGDGHSGSLVVLRPLHGHFLEALGVSWRDGEGIVEVFFEPITTTAAAEERACTLADGGDLERIPVSFAVDLLTPVIWNHRRRHGSVPDVLQRFADLFAAPSEP